MAWFIAVAESQGLQPEQYVIHLQNDPLKEYTGRGAFVLPIDTSVRLAADVVEYTARNGHRHWKPIGICGSQYRWGGANAVQEIAFGLCEAISYIEELTARGLDVDSFAPMLEMHLTADIDIFEEAAKFWAARRVWARILKERFGAKDPESCQLKISLYTAGYRLTKREPLNNSVRIALQALAAALGGVQHIGTLSMDEALSTPSEEAVKLAVRTQQILGYEAHVGHVADPLGGSYYVEHLTNEIEAQVWRYIEEVDQLGGAIVAIRSGYFQKFMDDGAYQFERDIESGERFVVGVNSFQDHRTDQAEGMKPFKIANTVETRQVERLNEVRATRDQGAVEAALSKLQESAGKHENVVPPLIEAVKAYASVGEICDVFRGLFGTYEDEQIVL
jgi:methylmalonyl-CoA mutase N-terminal domain/subunit